MNGLVSGVIHCEKRKATDGTHLNKLADPPPKPGLEVALRHRRTSVTHTPKGRPHGIRYREWLLRVAEAPIHFVQIERPRRVAQRPPARRAHWISLQPWKENVME